MNKNKKWPRARFDSPLRGCHSAMRGKALTAAWISAAGAPAGPLQKPGAALLPCRALLQQKLRRKAHLFTRPSTKVDGRCFFVGGARCASPDHESRRVPRPGHDSCFWPDAATLVLPPRAGGGGLLACTHLFQAGARDGLGAAAGGPENSFSHCPAKLQRRGGGQNAAAGRTKRRPVLGTAADALWIVFVLSFGWCTVQEGFLRCFISWCR